MLQKYK